MDRFGVPDTTAVDAANLLLAVAVAAVLLYLCCAMLRAWFGQWIHRRRLRKEVEHEWRDFRATLPPAA